MNVVGGTLAEKTWPGHDISKYSHISEISCNFVIFLRRYLAFWHVRSLFVIWILQCGLSEFLCVTQALKLSTVSHSTHIIASCVRGPFVGTSPSCKLSFKHSSTDFMILVKPQQACPFTISCAFFLILLYILHIYFFPGSRTCSRFSVNGNRWLEALSFWTSTSWQQMFERFSLFDIQSISKATSRCEALARTFFSH